MNDAPLFLLIDQGGQSTRVSVADAEGCEIARARRAVCTETPEPGRAEQDGRGILADLYACIREALSASEVDAGNLVAAALAVQRGNVLCWDRETGSPLTPVLAWNDRRQPKRLPADDIGERMRAETGLRHTPYGGAAKLRWCLENVPAVADALKAERLAFGPLGAWLARELIAGHPCVVDDTLAQRTLLFSRRRLQWSPQLLEAFGLPAEPLPSPRASDHDFGPLEPTLEFARPLPLRLLIGDQNVVPDIDAPDIDAPDIDAPDSVYINLGTGAFVLRPLPAGACEDPAGPFQLTMLGRRDDIRGTDARYALEGSVHAAGAALEWLAAASGVARADLPIDEALSPDTEPAFFVNTADGLGSPWWRRGDRREFLPAGGSLPQRLAAVVENMVFLLRVNLEQLEELRGPARRIVVAGGLSRNAALCQRLADGLQRRIQRLDGGEATIIGMWRRLSGSNAPGPGFSTLDPAPAPALERRYSEWRRQMPPVPKNLA